MHDGEVLRTEGASMRVLFTPGHANDHVSLVLEEEGSIFTADNVLGVGTAVFSDLSLYLASLTRMRQESQALGNVGGHGHNVMLYPGHGPVIENGVNSAHSAAAAAAATRLLHAPRKEAAQPGDA